MTPGEEARARERLGKAGLDETLVEYVVGVLGEMEAEAKEAVEEVLVPTLVAHGAVATEDEARELVGGLRAEAKADVAAAAVAAQRAPQPAVKKTGAAADIKVEDSWGVRSVPITMEVNTVVDRIETAQERARRERKEQKAAAKEEIQLRKENEAMEREKAVGVLGQVTASGAASGDAAGASTASKKNQVFSNGGDVNVPHVSISVGATGRELLRDATLKLARGGRYALIGKNGVGKSTLLSHIARRDLEGFPVDLSVLYVAQEVSGTDSTPVEVCLRGDAELQALRDREAAAVKANDADAVAAAQAALAAVDADSAEARAREVLFGLGFTPDMMRLPTRSLSGGWRMRAALAAALFASPDVLMLDEPTNGLSLDAIVFLEDYLTTHLAPTTTLMVVSHDRVFLNNVATNVILFQQQTLEYFKGDIDAFEKIKEAQDLHKQRSRDAQLGKIAHMQKFVDRFRYNAKRASLAQSRLKAIARLESSLADEVFQEPEMMLEFPEPDSVEMGTGFLLRAEGVAFAHAGSPVELFKDVDFDLHPGSKVVLLGENGKGKTTFLSLLAGTLQPVRGVVRRKPNARVAVFAQHQIDVLDLRSTALDFLLAKFPGTTAVDMRPHLARYGVTAELAQRRIGTLSGGQKARVGLALITWTRPHVLLMDEPTSHLDMETADALIAALAAFDGAVFVVSHDQNLITTLPDELWVLENNGISKWNGEFDDYKKKLFKEKAKREREQQLAAKAAPR